MYEVGEYIVHPGQGVCKVEDVIENPEVSYMLMPVGTPTPMRISFPISGENRLRPVLSHDEAQELVDEYTDLSIEEVARQSGVGSTTNLFYACHRDFHCSPSQRRRHLRQANDLGRYR